MYSDKEFNKAEYFGLRETLMERFLQTEEINNLPNDLHEGSILRTLLETFAHELALAYEQMDRVYDMGYLETANDRALDKLAQLAGLERIQPGRLKGEVSFGVKTVQKEDIIIPAGTQVTGKGKDIPIFETLDEVTLLQGSLSATAIVQSQLPTGATIKPETLIFMPKPVKGIESVNNASAITSKVSKETDDEFKRRIKKSTLAGQSGTRTSIEETIRTLGYKNVKVQEKHSTERGIVTINLSDESILTSPTQDDDLLEIEEALEKIRPAGIMYKLVTAPSVYVQMAAQVILAEKVSESEMDDLRQSITATIKSYFENLGAGVPLKWLKLKNILTTPDLVGDVQQIHKDSTTKVPYLTIINKGSENNTSKLRYVDGDPTNEPDKIFVNENERVILEGEPQVMIRLPENEVFLIVNLNGIAGLDLNTVKDTYEHVFFGNQEAENRTYTYAKLKEQILELMPPGTDPASLDPVYSFTNATTGKVTALKSDGDSIAVDAHEQIKLSGVEANV